MFVPNYAPYMVSHVYIKPIEKDYLCQLMTLCMD